MPPGLIGTSVARLCVTWTSSTLLTLCSTSKASRKNQIVSSRRPQSASCQSDDRPEVARGRPQHGERLSDARPEVLDPGPQPDRKRQPRDGEGEQDPAVARR